MMKTKLPTKNTLADKALGTRKKPKSLRPMRSMMAVRSLKPKTVAAAVKMEVEAR